MLEEYIHNRLKTKKILLMTHIVIGYPSLPASMELVEAMVEAGVDLMELQVPFSEPIADGPVIMRANQKALAKGIRVSQCLEFAEKVTSRFKIPFLIMSYYNPIFKYGVQKFVGAMSQRGIKGAIVADLPPEEAGPYLEAMQSEGLDPVFIFAPTTKRQRMARIAGFSRGMIYCVARKGVTGKRTDFSTGFEAYLERCRAATSLPLAVGFGVAGKEDVDYLATRAEVAVIGTKTLEVVEEKGLSGLKQFLVSLTGKGRRGIPKVS